MLLFECRNSGGREEQFRGQRAGASTLQHLYIAAATAAAAAALLYSVVAPAFTAVIQQLYSNAVIL